MWTYLPIQWAQLRRNHEHVPAPLIESISKLSEKTKFAMNGTGTGRFEEKKTQKLNTNMIGGDKTWVRCCLIMFFSNTFQPQP